MTNIISSNDYKELLVEIKQRVRSAQYEALKAVNKELISLYWDIGRIIVERQQGKTWGKTIVKNLAKDLQSEFSGIIPLVARNATIPFVGYLWGRFPNLPGIWEICPTK